MVSCYILNALVLRRADGELVEEDTGAEAEKGKQKIRRVGTSDIRVDDGGDDDE